MRKKIVSVVAGARPNFVKVAPILRSLRASGRLTPRLVHTGQHYDFNMSDVFFRDLCIPKPNAFLGIGSGSHGDQTGRTLSAFENDCLKFSPDAVLVVGDVNSTVAAALAAVKLRIPVAHVEAGLRSLDPDMPEEHNRIVVDSLSSWLFASESAGSANLKGRLYPWQKVYLVGNVMIDSLVFSMPVIDRSDVLQKMSLRPGKYAVATIHRPSNTDDPVAAGEISRILGGVAQQIPLIFPVHPRSRRALRHMPAVTTLVRKRRLILCDPLGYADFLSLTRHAKLVLTDSGGIQEETTFLRVPCLTMRNNTERPATVEAGSNLLVGRNRDLILNSVSRILAGRWKRARTPKLWDGRASERITRILEGNVR